ncbi:MAG: hypothetical protein M1282_10340 [Chloroflexi bacterium]|nr:hypothetical protein [Chloroflexota bacterium]
MKSKTVLAVLLAVALVAVVVASAAAAAPSQAVSTDTPTATLTETPAPSETPSPMPTANPCMASGGTSSGGGTPVVVGTSTGSDSSEGNAGQPVAEALCNFFNTNLGLTYDDITGLHQQGFGFGEIAQACWMALELQQENTTGDTTLTCQQILDAKQGNDISSLGLGVSNWGQLKKLVLKNPHMNLGFVVTGRAVGLLSGTSFPGNGHGQGNGNGQGGNPGNGHGHGPGGH